MKKKVLLKMTHTDVYSLNPSVWAGCDARSILKWSLTDLNSELSFS